ncbi:MAG: hypothetical protein KC964_13645, partial [Candidatus Omnitrophica bacterium]|nr:hypothetical protein [Candidatus Omnitrophota bacterium]
GEGIDFGDAPARYGTLLPEGARHHFKPGDPYLGAMPPDSEFDGIPNAHAMGDDAKRNISTLDPSFGEGGRVASTFEQAFYAFDLAIQEDGKLVVAGYVQLSA